VLQKTKFQDYLSSSIEHKMISTTFQYLSNIQKLNWNTCINWRPARIQSKTRFQVSKSIPQAIQPYRKQQHIRASSSKQHNLMQPPRSFMAGNSLPVACLKQTSMLAQRHYYILIQFHWSWRCWKTHPKPAKYYSTAYVYFNVNLLTFAFSFCWF